MDSAKTHLEKELNKVHARPETNSSDEVLRALCTITEDDVAARSQVKGWGVKSQRGCQRSSSFHSSETKAMSEEDLGSCMQ